MNQEGADTEEVGKERHEDNDDEEEDVKVFVKPMGIKLVVVVEENEGQA